MSKFSSNIKVFAFLVLATLISSASIANYTHPGVTQLINADNDPAGVVFELIENDKKTWEWAAPMIKDLRAQLKEKYPDIEIAVVSHGREQFQLTKKRVKHQQAAISVLENLVREQDVNLHVCGTHSSWYEIPESSYIDIVDVAVSGPAKINDYINLGYQPILLYKKQAD